MTAASFNRLHQVGVLVRVPHVGERGQEMVPTATRSLAWDEAGTVKVHVIGWFEPVAVERLEVDRE